MNNPLAGTDPTGYVSKCNQNPTCQMQSFFSSTGSGGSSLIGNLMGRLKTTLSNGHDTKQAKKAQEPKAAAEIQSPVAVASRGSGGAGGEQRRADEALFDDSPLDSSAQDQAFAAANDDSDDRELSAGIEWSADRAIAYQLGGQAGLDAYNQGLDNGLEIGLFFAPLPPVAIGAKYGYKAYQASKILKGRQRYVGAVTALSKQVATMRKAGVSSETIARSVHASRRALGVKFKNLTPADLLKKIYARNMEKYGDKLGPTIDYLRRRGKSWEDIIESATRTGGKDLGL